MTTKKKHSSPKISEEEMAGKKLQKVTLYTKMRNFCEASAVRLDGEIPDVIRRALTLVDEGIRRGIFTKNFEFSYPTGNVQEDIAALRRQLEESQRTTAELQKEALRGLYALLDNAPFDSAIVAKKTEAAVARAYELSDAPSPETTVVKETVALNGEEQQRAALKESYDSWST